MLSRAGDVVAPRHIAGSRGRAAGDPYIHADNAIFQVLVSPGVAGIECFVPSILAGIFRAGTVYDAFAP